MSVGSRSPAQKKAYDGFGTKTPMRKRSLLCSMWTAWTVCLSGLAFSQVDFIDQQFTVNKTSDIVYATGAVQSPTVGDKDLLLDLFEPAGVEVPALKPGYIFIHGGGFTSGTKTDFPMMSMATQFTERGYVCVSIDYRLTGDDPPTPGGSAVVRAISAATEDASNAVRWMKDNAVEYGIDPNRIAMGGYSAGAVTSLFTGYRELGSDVEVHAIMSMAGALYGSESEIDSNDPPLFMFHGDDDDTVPYSRALDIEAAAIAASITYEFYTLSGYGHGIVGPALGSSPTFGGQTLTELHRDFMYRELELSSDKVYVDFANDTGHENGSDSTPWNTLSEALAVAETGGVVYIKGETSELLLISQSVTLSALNGTVIIGKSVARNAAVAGQSGFVSRRHD
jgi:acetyl esterase/lipase